MKEAKFKNLTDEQLDQIWNSVPVDQTKIYANPDEAFREFRRTFARLVLWVAYPGGPSEEQASFVSIPGAAIPQSIRKAALMEAAAECQAIANGFVSDVNPDRSRERSEGASTCAEHLHELAEGRAYGSISESTKKKLYDK